MVASQDPHRNTHQKHISFPEKGREAQVCWCQHNLCCMPSAEAQVCRPMLRLVPSSPIRPGLVPKLLTGSIHHGLDLATQQRSGAGCQREALQRGSGGARRRSAQAVAASAEKRNSSPFKRGQPWYPNRVYGGPEHPQAALTLSEGALTTPSAFCAASSSLSVDIYFISPVKVVEISVLLFTPPHSPNSRRETASRSAGSSAVI